MQPASNKKNQLYYLFLSRFPKNKFNYLFLHLILKWKCGRAKNFPLKKHITFQEFPKFIIPKHLILFFRHMLAKQIVFISIKMKTPDFPLLLNHEMIDFEK